MMCIDDVQFAGEVVSLRAKVSHSWLDHEISMIDTPVAVTRWRSGNWPTIACKWESMHDLALEFGEMLHRFSAAALVDTLPVFDAMELAAKGELRARLDALHQNFIDTPALRTEYLARLQTLWSCAVSFFSLAQQPGAGEAEIVSAWGQVRGAGAQMKALFTSGLIPSGVVLP
ncbi:hypothetical protein [Polaromonas sp.]|uniref:hypothetical protein n=1 Tax=Polaromonas sp. TaxID=1869339 RepID=UPI002732101A|nr:hypothetical protein [Polaromonas sp.]MDP1740944.1 hypothetical protein [Polaromonas sp.]